MKCPFRVITTVRTLPPDHELREMEQVFAECYGSECPAARMVQHNQEPWKVEGCYRIKD